VNVPSALLIVYGDSIALGYNATNRATLGWAPRLRSRGFAPVLDAVDGKRLTNDVASAAGARTLVARWLRWRPTDVWIAIGTNDGFAQVPVATFKTAYGYVLDELEARAPHVNVYAQTPIVRIGEAGLTIPLSAYRTAIGELAAARPRVTLVDGLSLVTLNELDVDGTHPTDAGHLVYADAVAPILGWDR